MQQLDSFYQTAIKRGYEISGTPLVIAEWNFNLFTNATVTNELDINDDTWIYTKDYFPPSSLVDGLRPGTGIFYSFTDDAYTMPDDSIGIDNNRYYMVDKDSAYKYWVSPVASSAVNVSFPATYTDIEEYPIDKCQLKVDYGSFIKSNKILVNFNLGPNPISWKIYVFEQTVNNWVQIATNPTVSQITGKCELWYNGTSWTTTQQLDSNIYQSIKAVRVIISTIDKPSDRVQLTTIAACREIDMTDRVISYDVNMSMDAEDFIHPVGQISSNDGSLVISNDDLSISNIDTSSSFYGMLSNWCAYRLYVKYDLSNYGGSTVNMRIATMYSNDWQQVNEYEYSVELFDVFKMLQMVKCPAVLIEGQSLGVAISQLLDMVGVDTYNLDPTDFDTTSTVKYFWSNGDNTVYDTLKSLCESQQAALFVDEFGKITLLTRTEIANDTDTSLWTFLGQQDGLDVASISNLKKKYALAANDVTINYNRREAKVDVEDITSQPLTTKVWDSSDTIVLRAEPMLLDIPKGSLIVDIPGGPDRADIRISPINAAFWPYVGTVNIDGEIFNYKGKGYNVFDYTTNTFLEKIINSDDEKKKYDKQSYDSYHPPGGPTGGESGIPYNGQFRNGFSGRLVILDRAQRGSQEANHSKYWIDGWMPLEGWEKTPGNSDHPTRYIEPGGPTYNINNVKDWKNRPGWYECQYRWTVHNSMVTCDASVSGRNNEPNLGFSCLIRDLNDTEYRELGTKFKMTGTSPKASIIFYLTNAEGYDNDSAPITDPVLATRFYMVNVYSSATCDKNGRRFNEVFAEVKNGDNITPLNNNQGSDQGAKIQINNDTWYDLSIVYRENALPTEDQTPTAASIEVFIDGQYVETFYTEDVIRPTSLVGLSVLGSGVVDFDYFYAATESHSRPKYNDNELFNYNILQLPSGTNVKKVINFATSGSWEGSAAISFAVPDSAATITSLKLKDAANSQVKELGPIALSADSRIIFFTDDYMFRASQIDITYTSTKDISVCMEYSKITNYPYDVLSPGFNINDQSYYDLIKGGYYSTKVDDFITDNSQSILNQYANQSDQTPGIFYDNFGSVVHEIRDFNVDLDATPAKSVKPYVSNDRVKILDYQYNPEKGIFSLANASYKNEIVNGTEEIDESNSIDQTILLYGYVLEDKGAQTKNIKDKTSIKKHGPYTMSLDATWINTDEEAQQLADWIVKHWSEPMDTIDMDVFSNTFTQIGDKVNIKYTNADIDPTKLYIVTGSRRSFDGGGFSSGLTVRRVR